MVFFRVVRLFRGSQPVSESKSVKCYDICSAAKLQSSFRLDLEISHYSIQRRTLSHSLANISASNGLRVE
jgi:hypothetical protein